MKSLGLVWIVAGLGLAGVLGGCDAEQGVEAASVPPPIADCTDPYACAARKTLATVPPKEFDGLHHFYRLSEKILCGGEPLTDGALGTLAEMGVKTILSVDGKAPQAETAKRLGMRYVHVPIRYGGMQADEELKIAKTFRELEAPFYVHCFHGRHRGPAAAVLGRIILDGAPREQALAEMRQWCGTAAKYTGLYKTIATGVIPTPKQTAAYGFDFASVHKIKGFRAGMVRMTRTFDNVQWLARNGWKSDEAHPDLDPANESAKLVQHFEQMARLKEIQQRPAAFHEWMDASLPAVRALREAVDSVAAGAAQAGDQATERLAAVKDLCSQCHKVYRNK